jgi:hypothetical protein
LKHGRVASLLMASSQGRLQAGQRLKVLRQRRVSLDA